MFCTLDLVNSIFVLVTTFDPSVESIHMQGGSVHARPMHLLPYLPSLSDPSI